MEDIELMKKLVEWAEKTKKKEKKSKTYNISDAAEEFAKLSTIYVDSDSDKTERRIALAMMLCSIYRELIQVMRDVNNIKCDCDCKCETKGKK